MATPGTEPNFGGRPAGGPHAHLMHQKVHLKKPLDTIRRIGSYLASRKKVLLIVLLCAILSTLITIIGTRLNGYTVDHFISTGNVRGLGQVCLVLIGLYLVNVGATYAQNILMISQAQRTAAELRRDLFTNMQRLPLRYFDTHSSGDLMSRLTNDIDNINIILSQSVVQLFAGVIMIAGMLVAMLLLSPFLTLINILTTPLMYLGTKILARNTQPHFISQQKYLGQLNGFIEESVSGQKVIQLFCQEKAATEKFAAINAQLTQSAIMAQGVSGIMGPLNNLINNLTYLIIAVTGGLLIIRETAAGASQIPGEGTMTVGVVFTFLLYMRNFTRPINDILNLFNTIQSALAGAERVFEVIDEAKESDPADAVAISQIDGHVEFSQVDFAYVPGRLVLQDARLEAQSGQTVAIVGPTGAGKTTIINLLTKFYQPDQGAIRIDGRDIHTITTHSLRQTISVVLQDPFLFSTTVRENIRYGRLTASDAEVEAAARQACVHGFIMQLPDGYDTVLSDNGSNLSQGQRQLLSIARAVLARSSVLVLDEATSSVDVHTEMLLQQALLALMRGKTSFVIAHRLSTIKNADKIIVIRDGRIVESGTHPELMTSGGYYADLYNSQFDRESDTGR